VPASPPASAGSRPQTRILASHFRQQARDWRLLLLVSSVEAAGMDWSGGGKLYYWILEDDLRARRFDRSWVILQTT
jgi:uncharacterized protein YwqG